MYWSAPFSLVFYQEGWFSTQEIQEQRKEKSIIPVSNASCQAISCVIKIIQHILLQKTFATHHFTGNKNEKARKAISSKLQSPKATNQRMLLADILAYSPFALSSHARLMAQ